MNRNEPGPRSGYHHGDLRAALIEAAEHELAERGVEAFSLRACARRAGVSHTAPAHHFGNVDGLLTALANEGFSRLEVKMRAAMDREGDARERLLASGRTYVAFARGSPALFRLMFSQRLQAAKTAEPAAPRQDTFALLGETVAAASRGRSPLEHRTAIAAAWAIVHGLAHLLIEGGPAVEALVGEPADQRAIDAVIRKALPD